MAVAKHINNTVETWINCLLHKSGSLYDYWSMRCTFCLFILKLK